MFFVSKLILCCTAALVSAIAKKSMDFYLYKNNSVNRGR